MSAVYHIENKINSPLKLFRLEDGTFNVIELGDFPAIILGHGFTLVQNDVVEVLKALLEREIQILPARIERRSTGDSWQQYSELIIDRKISSDLLTSGKELSGNIWTYDNHIFVSERVKKQLEAVAADRLRFSLGFSRFA